MTEDIPDEAEQAIEQLSNQYNTDPGTLREDYAEYRAEWEERGASDPHKRALRRLALDHKGGQMQDEESLRGYVLGASDPINTSRSAIERAREFVKKQGVEAAVKQGLVKKAPSGSVPGELASLSVTRGEETEVYAVLDTNDNSPTSGEVLPAEDWIRYVYGAAWQSPDDGPEWFSGVINADDDRDHPEVPPLREPVKFRAVWVGESNQNNTVRLRFRDPDTFEVLDDFNGPGVLELFEDDSLIGHVPLEEANPDNYRRNDVFVTYGTVTYMDLSPGGDNSRRLSVTDPFAFDSDLSRTVWLPDHVDVNFQSESDVYVVGQASPSNNEYPDNIEALGIMPHPDYVVDRSGVESMGGDDKEPKPEATPESLEGGGEEPEPEPEPEPEGASPAEAGEDLKPPEEVEVESDHEAEFDTAADVAEGTTDAPQEEGAPPVVRNANYEELRRVASGVEGIPGSGLTEDETRKRLRDELGDDELGRRLIDGEQDGQGATTQEATTDGGEADAGGEPDDGDDEWEW